MYLYIYYDPIYLVPTYKKISVCNQMVLCEILILLIGVIN